MTNDSSIKVIQEDFSMRVPNDLSLKDLLEEVGMRGMSNLSRKDLLEDFGARAMRDLNVKVNFGDLRMPQACRGSEVNVVIHLLALRVWLLSRSGKTETFVHAWVYVGGDEDPVLRGPAGPPVCTVQVSVLPSVRQEVVIPVGELRNFPARLRR